MRCWVERRRRREHVTIPVDRRGRAAHTVSMRAPYANVVGFDDAPFTRDGSSEVGVVGAVYAAERLDGVLCGHVTRDGDDAATRLAELIERSRFLDHLTLVFLQGITLGGFNVIDIHELAERVSRPVLVVARREPDWPSIHAALAGAVPGGEAKRARLDRAGAMEAMAGVWVQRAGIDPDAAEAAILRHRRHGLVPEPIRVAHLIAGAVGGAGGHSRGRA